MIDSVFINIPHRPECDSRSTKPTRKRVGFVLTSHMGLDSCAARSGRLNAGAVVQIQSEMAAKEQVQRPALWLANDPNMDSICTPQL